MCVSSFFQRTNFKLKFLSTQKLQEKKIRKKLYLFLKKSIKNCVYLYIYIYIYIKEQQQQQQQQIDKPKK